MIDKQIVDDVIQWDVRNWSEALRFWDQNIDWSAVHHCLEVGSKTGGLALWFALHHKPTVCSDITDTAHVARQHHQKYPLDPPMSYEIIDATEIPYENHFDLVAFKSVLGGIGGNGRKDLQQRAIDEIYKALRPGGKLLFVENLTGSYMHQWVRRRFLEWGDWWRYVTRDEMREFLRRFARVELRTTGVLSTFGRSERQRSILGAIDQAVLKRVTPPRWHYLTYGYAEK
ncbi:MAG: class I SAM-dependent methyltransferase [Pirellulales bacterium]